MSKQQFPIFNDPPEPLRVRSILCYDQKGKVQIVALEHALIDLMNVEEAIARELQLAPPAADAQICAIPGFYNLPTVIDADLLELSELALASDIPGNYVKASGKDLGELCGQQVAFETHFARRLQATPVHNEGDEDDILGAVEAFTTRRIRTRLNETLDLPPLPQTAQRIIAMHSDPNVVLADLVSVIEADPPIAAKLIGWANAARYARPNTVLTLQDAIMRCLGFDMVFNMALGMAVGATLKLPRTHVSSTSNYWLDAVYTAATAEALAHFARPDLQVNAGTCYLGGLLADFGTLVLGHIFPPQYEQICRIQQANPQHHRMNADQYVMNLSREVLAAYILNSWSLPAPIVNMVRFQNVIDYAEADLPYVQVLQLAGLLLEDNDTPDREQHKASLCVNLGIEEAHLNEVIHSLHQSRLDLGELAAALKASS
ncbi:MAG: HDOD domain-containing protein [Pseudomonadota bacterium]